MFQEVAIANAQLLSIGVFFVYLFVLCSFFGCAAYLFFTRGSSGKLLVQVLGILSSFFFFIVFSLFLLLTFLGLSQRILPTEACEMSALNCNVTIFRLVVLAAFDKDEHANHG